MKGFRTLLINIALAVAPVIQATGAADLGLVGTSATVYGLFIAAVNFGMRLITTTPVGQK